MIANLNRHMNCYAIIINNFNCIRLYLNIKKFYSSCIR